MDERPSTSTSQFHSHLESPILIQFKRDETSSTLLCLGSDDFTGADRD